MGEATTGFQQAVQQVDLVREHLSEVVAEPDYRRQTDWRDHLSRHAGLLIAVAGAVGLAVAIAATLAVVNRQRA